MTVDLKQFFKLEQDSNLYNHAIKPKSCGGDATFKYLALFGDRVLNLSLLEIISKDLNTGLSVDSGILTQINQAIHNKRTLTQLGNIFGLFEVLKPIDPNQKISYTDISECIEALLGASYKINGLPACKEIVENLLDYVGSGTIRNDSNDLSAELDVNYKGKLLELFQAKKYPLPQFDPRRVGGPDHNPVFQCNLKGIFDGKEFSFDSDLCSSVKDAERNVSYKFLVKIGSIDIVDLIPMKKSEIENRAPVKQSITENEVIFSKTGLNAEKQYPDINISKNTGESLLSWVLRKVAKNPFGMLLLLSARIPEVSGGDWTASIESGELVILNVKIDDHHYFEIGFGSSKTKARNDAATKVIKNSKLIEWIEQTYKEEVL